MNTDHVLLVLAAMAAVTFALRALPFVAAQWLQKHPVVQKLGDFLPLGIMTLLVLTNVVAVILESVPSIDHHYQQAFAWFDLLNPLVAGGFDDVHPWEGFAKFRRRSS